MYIQLSEAMYYSLLDPNMDFIFKERGRFNVKASLFYVIHKLQLNACYGGCCFCSNPKYLS